MQTTFRLDASYQRKASPAPRRVRPSRAIALTHLLWRAGGLKQGSRWSAPPATPPRMRRPRKRCAPVGRQQSHRNSPRAEILTRPAPSEARSISATPDRVRPLHPPPISSPPANWAPIRRWTAQLPAGETPVKCACVFRLAPRAKYPRLESRPRFSLFVKGRLSPPPQFDSFVGAYLLLLLLDVSDDVISKVIRLSCVR